MVNGPEDVDLDSDAVDWRLHEENVRRLRQRIFKAAQEGDLATVRNLQKLMLRSWSDTLVSVRQATQRNAGRKTAGVDGQVALTLPGQGGADGASAPGASSWRPRPVKRVFIPKAGNPAKLQPLGILTKAAWCRRAQ
jgi:RNA-directed DNA polymerase